VNLWQPTGFAEYRQLFPSGPALEPLARSDATAEFVATWNGQPASIPPIPDICFVFVRGLFGSWIPRHFTCPLQTLERAGLRAIIANTRAAGTIEENARAVARDVLARVGDNDRIIFLCHSKGGLDALVALGDSPPMRERTAGVVICQTPRGGCAVLEAVFSDAYREVASSRDRVKEALARAVLDICAARAGCLDITSGRIEEWVRRIDGSGPTLPPILSVASWSARPTSWLESQHARLAAIRPACAHDGLFFTEHLIWPVGEQVLLPGLDHSQPGVGGGGFDHGRFWLALAQLALRRAPASEGLIHDARGACKAER
jgi:hypothetical protein